MNNQTSVGGSGKNYKFTNFVIYSCHHYVQINDNVICCANEQEKDELCLYGFSKNPKWEEPLGRPRLKQEDNIKMCLKSMTAVSCIHLAQHSDQPGNIMLHKTQYLDWLSNCRWSCSCWLLKPSGVTWLAMAVISSSCSSNAPSSAGRNGACGLAVGWKLKS
jgi:hypothetical protein